MTGTRQVADISVIVLAADEGTQLHGCMASVRRAVAQAQSDGWSSEIVIVASGRAARTAAWLDEFAEPQWRVVRRVDARLGTALRAGHSASRGRFMSVITADSMWSKNWLSMAMGAAARGRPAVWRHEAVVNFGDSYYSPHGYAFALQGELDANVSPLEMLGANPYAASFLADRSVADNVAFPVEDHDRGWGFADWWWACRLADAGYRQAIVPGTFLYRQVDQSNRPGSMRLHPAGARPGPVLTDIRAGAAARIEGHGG